MAMKRWLKRSMIILLTVVVIALSFAFLMLFHMTNRADAAMYDEIQIAYEITDDYIKVESPAPVAHLVYYPGGLVEAESYLYQAALLAESGVNVIIPKMPLKLAILNRDAFYDYYTDDGLPWYLAGHSLGGASASYSVGDDEGKIEGLILLAAYPPSGLDLSQKDIKVLSIQATLDGVLNHSIYNERKALLPADTVYQTIVGGNHAQFGFYGSQRGDNTARISTQKQQSMITAMIISFIKDD